MVTPAFAESIDESQVRGIPVLAGALTPTEAYEAMNRGATAVKLFPASIGGPRYLKALRDPFPEIPSIAVGGVGLDEAAGYWEAGAIAVGLGGPLFGDADSAATWPPCVSGPAASSRLAPNLAAERPRRVRCESDLFLQPRGSPPRGLPTS